MGSPFDISTNIGNPACSIGGRPIIAINTSGNPLNAVTQSLLIDTATTSSYSVTASYVLQAISASFATSASRAISAFSSSYALSASVAASTSSVQ